MRITPEQLARAGTEHGHQCAVFCWAADNAETYPDLASMFAIPNGGMRDKITAANLKAEGVKKHVPDIFLPVPRGSWHGMFIEMKKPGGVVDPGQKAYLKTLQYSGYVACVCVGWQEAVTSLKYYLNFR